LAKCKRQGTCYIFICQPVKWLREKTNIYDLDFPAGFFFLNYLVDIFEGQEEEMNGIIEYLKVR
jgi:hypothetical protein